MCYEEWIARLVTALPEISELQAFAITIDNLADCINRAADGFEGSVCGVDSESYGERQLDRAQKHVRVLKSKFVQILREMRIAIANAQIEMALAQPED